MAVPVPPRPPAGHYTNTGIGTTLGSIAGGPIGALAGTVAESLIASAFADKGPGFRELLNTSRTAQDKQIMGHFASTIKAANTYGVHPLVALGISPSSGGFNLSQDVSSGMGQNIGRAVRSAFSGSRQEQELADLAVERARLENDLLRSQISNINYQPGDPRTVDTPAGPVVVDRTQKAGSRWSHMISPDGKTTRVLNTELAGDNEALMFYDFAISTLPDELKNTFKRTVAQTKMNFKSLRNYYYSLIRKSMEKAAK